jgi:Mrp family chromosome partitioning ATPase
MKSLFEVIDTSVYDFIIVDTPPVTRVVDTLALGHFIRNSILIVRQDVSYKETVLQGIQELGDARIKIRGIVANAAEIQKSYYYRYRYGYGYGYSSLEGGTFKSKIKIGKKQKSKVFTPSKSTLSDKNIHNLSI